MHILIVKAMILGQVTSSAASRMRCGSNRGDSDATAFLDPDDEYVS